jgi:hypothetical protein
MSEATYKKVTLNGEEHVLKYGFNAIAELEEYYGKGIFSIVNEDSIGFNTVRSILWAGMLWKNSQLKVNHVGAMLEKEMEENEDFDLQSWMEITLESLSKSKAFQLLAKRANGDKKGKN